MARTSAEGRFSGMVVYFVETGIQPRRLQVWKQKIEQLGAEFVNHLSRRVTHIFSINSKALSERVGHERLKKLKRIQEILQTGCLSKLDHFEKDEKIRTISLFGEVWGIGPATALKLYEKGHRTLEDLKKDDSLTPVQRIGLEFFDDIKRKIPRNEVQDMELMLQRVAQDIVPGVVVVCGGSYRRGKAFCGDMDFVITHPDGTSHKGFLSKFVKYLKDIGFLKEDLLFSIHSTEVYTSEIYAFGLIAWTGNDVLNRRLRLLAEAKGYKLDDTGLFPVTRNSTGKKVAMASSSFQCKTEREVFDFLGFPWLEPHERNL